MNCICLLSEIHYNDLGELFDDNSYIMNRQYIKVEGIKLEYIKDKNIIRHINAGFNYDDYNILIKLHIYNDIGNNIKIVCTEIYDIIKALTRKFNINILYNQIGYTRINNIDKDIGILTILYGDDIEDYYIKDTLIESISGNINTSTFVHDMYL